MKPIALVTSQFPPQVGGVGHSCARVARLLARGGRDVHVVAFQKHPEPVALDEAITSTREGELLVHRVLVHHPPGASEAEVLTRSNREMFQALDLLMRRHDYAVLHGFFLYPGAYIAGIVGRLHGARVIASIRGNDVGKYAFDPLRLGFVRSAIEHADAVTSVATSLLELADRALAPLAGRGRTILNSIDPARLAPRERPELPLQGTVIGSSGLFRYKKGLVHLFKALESLNGGLDYTLLMAGDWFGPEDRVTITREIEQHGLAARTQVTGRIAPERMGDYIRLFDIMVFPSLFSEGCPISMLEAMALGRPIVASRVAAIPEILRHGENGLLVEPGSSSEIAAAIRDLVRDPLLARRIGEGARATALAMNPDHEAAQWSEVYAKL
ncbi:MAG TPA: glycosyltransferase [Methylomirabilota bacterium]|jgi:glycosyltransferase involved in cell wall biosynthesis|nr:glycosyltransferase [Methylomirabilota bacterium]